MGSNSPYPTTGVGWFDALGATLGALSNRGGSSADSYGSSLGFDPNTVPTTPGGMPGVNGPAGAAAIKRLLKQVPMSQGKGGWKATSIDDAELEPLRWTGKKLETALRQMSAATGKPITDKFQLQQEWAKLVKMSAQYWAASNGGKIPGVARTPSDILNEAAQTGKTAGAVSLTSQQTHSSVDEISDGTAWGYMSNAATQMLGRAPTEGELRRFISKAHDIASRNPSITTQTTKTDSKGNTTTSSKTKGGADAGDYAAAAQKLASTPEAAAYQAAGTYFNALVDMLDSPVNLTAPTP